MELFDRATPQENRLSASRLTWWMIVVVITWVLALLLLDTFAPNRPVKRESELDHFYYGSIGSDISGGLPVRVLQVLPATFPQYLPQDAPHDLTAFGFIQQSGEPLPIGFSTRRQLIDRTAMNCATCHTGVVRESADTDPLILPGAPANTVNLQAYFRFLFDVAADEDFTSKTITDALEDQGLDSPLDWLLYPIIIPRMRAELLARQERNAFLFDPEYPAFGPGRVNTFDTFKVDQLAPYYAEHTIHIEPKEMFGNVDFPSIWNQRPREGLALHWDGNQTSVRERNFSAAIGAGARPEDMDIDSLFRIENWLRDLPPPKYPFEIDAALAQKGESIYREYCHDCHDFTGRSIAKVMSLTEIGTDPYRSYSYTQDLLEAQQDYTEGYFWAFENFSVTAGYSSHPLDGIWARAPYLHNGSVPSLWDLLSPEGNRPVAFELGVEVYDPIRMGFDSERLAPSDDGYRRADGKLYDGGRFILDTRLKGNGSQGHSGKRFGTALSDSEKHALIEYLKTM
ncbi:cytochrome c [Qingshengfaniella alkalisoli]|uniref:Cytochrome c n=1 Tax=Qingshengfaniella alkalisoli TaxID=2599296 RepID=A0A5B8ID68_9RHOB|nr:cytochrome c [Qingshengfaniella alkalisoli]QDY71596.1 cytochrome c [Qingshengfaniella alkalisoli]